MATLIQVDSPREMLENTEVDVQISLSKQDSTIQIKIINIGQYITCNKTDNILSGETIKMTASTLDAKLYSFDTSYEIMAYTSKKIVEHIRVYVTIKKQTKPDWLITTSGEFIFSYGGIYNIYCVGGGGGGNDGQGGGGGGVKYSNLSINKNYKSKAIIGAGGGLIKIPNSIVPGDNNLAGVGGGETSIVINGTKLTAGGGGGGANGDYKNHFPGGGGGGGSYGKGENGKQYIGGKGGGSDGGAGGDIRTNGKNGVNSTGGGWKGSDPEVYHINGITENTGKNTLNFKNNKYGKGAYGEPGIGGQGCIYIELVEFESQNPHIVIIRSGRAGYLGVSHKARKVRRAYFGVNGVAREIKRAYFGNSQIARQWYPSIDGTNMDSDFPRYMPPSTTKTFKIWGAEPVEDIRYRIEAGDSNTSKYLSLSKTTDIKENEELKVTTKTIPSTFVETSIKIYAYVADYPQDEWEIPLIKELMIIADVEYKVPGTYYFTVPKNVTKITVYGVGAGGGGGGAGCAQAIGHASGGGGGGGGAWAYGSNYIVTPNTNMKVIVGAGGAGGRGTTASAGVGSVGATGGTTSLTDPSGKVIFSLGGGAGGGPGRGGNPVAGGYGGAGGIASVGGNAGGAGGVGGASPSGGGGGGAYGGVGGANGMSGGAAAGRGAAIPSQLTKLPYGNATKGLIGVSKTSHTGNGSTGSVYVGGGGGGGAATCNGGCGGVGRSDGGRGSDGYVKIVFDY